MSVDVWIYELCDGLINRSRCVVNGEIGELPWGMFVRNLCHMFVANVQPDAIGPGPALNTRAFGSLMLCYCEHENADQ